MTSPEAGSQFENGVDRNYEDRPNVERLRVQVGHHQLDAAVVHARPDLARPDGSNPAVLMIGGIPRNAENQPDVPLFSSTFGPLSETLANRGMNSMVMNPAGMGGSEGDTFQESLNSRIDSWVTATRVLVESGQADPHDLSIVGNSMGGHIAIRVAERLQAEGFGVKKLVLVSPAAYGANAEDKRYGPEFSAALREPGGLETSPVISGLQRFIEGGGKVMLSWVESDKPIPQTVKDAYESVVGPALQSGEMVNMQSYLNVEHNFRAMGTDPKDNIVNPVVRDHGRDQMVDFLVKNES